MPSSEHTYIWQQADWPHWRYDLATLTDGLTQVNQEQGKLLGTLSVLGLAWQEQNKLAVFSQDVLQTSAIEGEILNAHSVRSSVARRLGMTLENTDMYTNNDYKVEGVVDMILDATHHSEQPLTLQKLCAWHAGLFPTGYSGIERIRVAALREEQDGPMQVVSAGKHFPYVHFEAPPAHVLPNEMARFLAWFNQDTQHQPLIKAGLAHVWFLTLHPFEDGNGRIARAITDRLLATLHKSLQRPYSLSTEIHRQRQSYYTVLERTQKNSLEVTIWLAWFLQSVLAAVQAAQIQVDAALNKQRYWQKIHQNKWPLNPRQINMVNMLLDGFEGKLTSSKWAKLTKCSADSALRDINTLLDCGVLCKSKQAGRSTHYTLRME